MDTTRRWFITKNGKEVHWVQSYIRQYIAYDDITTHCIVAMTNNLNTPDAYGCKVEEICIKDFFRTKEKAQLEILRRERFDK